VGATQTVEFFVTQFNAIGRHDTDEVALDLETTDGLPAKKVAA
jgi:hypothetical protein